MSKITALHIYALFMHIYAFCFATNLQPTCNHTTQSSYRMLLTVIHSYWNQNKDPYRPLKADSEPLKAVGVCSSVSSLKPPVIGQQIPSGRLFSHDLLFRKILGCSKKWAVFLVGSTVIPGCFKKFWLSPMGSTLFLGCPEKSAAPVMGSTVPENLWCFKNPQLCPMGTTGKNFSQIIVRPIDSYI